MTNYQKDKIFVNKFIQKFLDDESKVSLENKYKIAEIASSLTYYLKSFSNINKLLDYICLIFKHIFKEKIILIMPLNFEGEIWNENIKISANNECLKIQQEINIFLSQFSFSKNFKIKKIIDKKVPDAIIESLLVLDASQGQNGLKQAKSFAKSANLSGAIITKLDGTSRGGVSLAVSQEVNLPIRFIGAGEGIKDLRPFNSYEFVEALLADK